MTHNRSEIQPDKTRAIPDLPNYHLSFEIWQIWQLSFEKSSIGLDNLAFATKISCENHESRSSDGMLKNGSL